MNNNDNTPNTYNIKATNFARLEAEIEVLNKKADKLGAPRAIITIHGEKTVKRKCEITAFEFTEVYKIVSVTGEAPKLSGWALIAVIEPLASGENLISCVPGQTCPVEYRTAKTTCDHCGHIRRRKEVFVLRHDDGHHCQVGRQCLADFLGGKSPEGILAYVAYCAELCKMLSDAGDDDWGWSGGGQERGYNQEQFLKMTAIVIRRLGWVSRTVASQMEFGGGPSATVNVVTWLLSKPVNEQDRRDQAKFIDKHNIVADDRDLKLAEEALAWGKALPTDAVDYIYNLGVACRLDYVTPKTAGIFASLIAAYQRHLDREAELNMKRAENAGKVRGHVGEVGKRQGFAGLTVKAMRSFESDFGAKTLVRFEDATGNILIWWASGDCDWLEEGDVVDVTATVKEHGEYKGTLQTNVNRVAKGLPKPKGKRKAKVVSVEVVETIGVAA